MSCVALSGRIRQLTKHRDSTSPWALANGREICLLIASMMDPGRDHLAVTATDPTGEVQVVSDMGAVDMARTRQHLDRARRISADASAPASLDKALEASADLLAGFEPQPGRYSSRSRRHIILVSSKAGEAVAQASASFPVHLVNPAIVPWAQSRSGSQDWQLCAMYPSRLRSTALSRDEDGLPTQLRKMMALMRTGNETGRLEEVGIAIQPGPDCEIEYVLGELTYASLSAGDVAQVFVRLKCVSTPTLAPGGEIGDDQGLYYLDVLTHLNTVLGQGSAQTLSVEVTYKHSLLPADTTLSVHASNSIKRHTSDRSWSSSRSLSFQEDSLRLGQFEKRFGFYHATHDAPRKSLATLQDIYGHDGGMSHCAVFMKQIMEELKYQAYVTERSMDRVAPVYESSRTTEDGRSAAVASYEEPCGGRSTSCATTSRAGTPRTTDQRRVQRTSIARDEEEEGEATRSTSVEDLWKLAEVALGKKRSSGEETLRATVVQAEAVPCA